MDRSEFRRAGDPTWERGEVAVRADPETAAGRRTGQDPVRNPAPDRARVQAQVQPQGQAQAQGQAQDQGQEQGPEAVRVTSEVVVIAERQPESVLEVPRATNVVTQRKIEERMPRSTPDALSEELGVVVQKTNMGGGSPIIRGRTGKDILLLIDGQRFNDATFRRNTQYLNTIDLAAVERLEVVRGPSSVLYGSDAMGGAINVITRRREPTGENAINGRLLGRFESANMGRIGHLGLDAEVEGFGFTGGFTAKKFDHLRAGSHGDPIGAVDIDGVQDPTAYDEFDFSFSVTKNLSESSSLDFLHLYSRQNEVPRSDRLIANEKQPVPPDLVRDFDPQILRWYELRFRYDDPGRTFAGLEVTATFNNPEERRVRVQTSAPDMTIIEEDHSEIPGLRVLANFALEDGHDLTVGTEAYYQTVNSDRKTVDTTSGMVQVNPGRYPDGAKYGTFGIFVQDHWQVSRRLIWTNGIRYSLNRVDFDLGGITVGPVGPFGEMEETYDDVTFSTSASYEVSPGTFVYGSFAKGFRAPNLDDLAVLGDFSSGERVPNVDVEPETVYSPEIGVKHQSARWGGEGAAAIAFYDNLLDNRFAFTSGMTDFFQIDNVGRAIIYTLEGLVSYVTVESDGFSPEHSAYVQAFLNYGENRTEDEPVSKIPPPQGEIGYRVEAVDGTFFGEAFLAGALEQDRLSSADMADPRFPIDGTPGWWTFNLRGGYSLNDDLRVSLALENIFDQRYRVHGSGIDAPGFNAVVQIELKF